MMKTLQSNMYFEKLYQRIQRIFKDILYKGKLSLKGIKLARNHVL